MVFSDKLNFLMNITQTSNKELAAGISVDRSLISLLRTGKRGIPRNPEHISHMATFFARRCTADFQRHALSEMLGQTMLRSSMPTEVLAGRISKWLSGEPDVIEHIMEEIDSAPKLSEKASSARQPSESRTSSNETLFYYSNEGKRNAMRYMMNIIRTMTEPCTILYASDDNLEWLFEDYEFTQELQTDLIEILQRGFTLYQIMPSVNFLNRYVESLRYWLPIYVTGQAKVFYYPRLRDNLYRRSTIILPGYCVQTSTGVGLNSNYITLVSTDSKLIRENINQFQDYLSLCRPALTVHDSLKDFIPCFQDILSRTGTTIQKTFPLSANTLPKELLTQLVKDTDQPGWKYTFQMYLDEIPRFEERLNHGPFIDISELATAQEIRSGKISIASPYKIYEEQPVYTPETYILHLQNILRLMEEHEDYHFVPSSRESRHDYNLFVNSDGLALLVRNAAPPLMFEIRRPEMVQACNEHLLRMADLAGIDGIQRTKTRMQIKALIRELQN